MSTQMDKKDIYIYDSSIEGVYLNSEHESRKYYAFNSVVFVYEKNSMNLHYKRVLDVSQRESAYTTDSKAFVLDLYKMSVSALNGTKPEIAIIDSGEYRQLYDNKLVISVHKIDDKYKLEYNLGDYICTVMCADITEMRKKARNIIHQYIDSNYPTQARADVHDANINCSTSNIESPEEDKIAELTRLLNEEKEKSAKLQQELDSTNLDLVCIRCDLEATEEKLNEKTAELEALTVKFNKLSRLIKEITNV